MADPTSWFTIEQGWEVLDRSGAPVGEVVAVVGDEDADIFDGLRFETAAGDERFIEADRVGDIVEGSVTLDAGVDELESGRGAEPPGGAEVRRDRDTGL